MKKVITICIIFLCAWQSLKAQLLHKINNKSTVSILCSMDTTLYRSNNSFTARIYLVGNKTGSANLPESDEISYKILIATSTSDDTPDQNLYEIKNMIYPKVLSFKESNLHEYILVLEYGASDRKKKNIKITENKCVETN